MTKVYADITTSLDGFPRAPRSDAHAGGTTYRFVTEGIDAALEQARAAAGGKDVGIWGGGRDPP